MLPLAAHVPVGQHEVAVSQGMIPGAGPRQVKSARDAPFGPGELSPALVRGI